MVHELDLELIKTFLDNLRAIEDPIKDGRVDIARERYIEILSLYTVVQNSKLDGLYKEMAYKELYKLYKIIISPHETQRPTQRKVQYGSPRSYLQKNIPPTPIRPIPETIIPKRFQEPDPIHPEPRPITPPKENYYYSPELEQIKPSKKLPPTIIITIILVLMLSVLVFFKPSLVSLAGLAVYDEKAMLSENVFLSFRDDSVYILELKHVPSSLALTGRFEPFSPAGDAKVYVEQNNAKQLIFDSKTEDRYFYKSCINCELSGTSKKVKLILEVKDAILDITKVHYTADKITNTPPEYASSQTEFQIKGKTEIELDRYFSDGDGDELVFVVTEPEGLDVSMLGNTAVIVPKQGAIGDFKATFIASDLIDLAKQTITFNVV